MFPSRDDGQAHLPHGDSEFRLGRGLAGRRHLRAVGQDDRQHRPASAAPDNHLNPLGDRRQANEVDEVIVILHVGAIEVEDHVVELQPGA